jgi:hypothetical protein
MLALMSLRTTSPAIAHLARKTCRKVAGASGDVEGALAGAQVRKRQRESLPQAMRAARHQIVHPIVIAGHGIEHAAHAPGFLAQRHALEAKVG